jgi:hypothetical protein
MYELILGCFKSIGVQRSQEIILVLYSKQVCRHCNYAQDKFLLSVIT